MSGALQGLVIAVAVALAFLLQTLAGRTPLSRQCAGLTQPESMERQVFVAASSATFVDLIGLALLSAALVIAYPDLSRQHACLLAPSPWRWWTLASATA